MKALLLFLSLICLLATASAHIPTPPLPPINLRIISASRERLVLAWVPSQRAAVYRLYKRYTRTYSGTFAWQSMGQTTSTSITKYFLPAGTYVWTVRAVNMYGESGNSNLVRWIQP